MNEPVPQLPVVEFYITNVCNLACENCNRFNNYRFRGWQAWQDHAAEYERWSRLIDFKQISILGGEPLLNPTVLDWCDGIRRLWPQSRIQLVSNGYHINRVPGLYDALSRNRILLYTSIHNAESQSWIQDQIQQFLGPLRSITSESPEVTLWKGLPSVWLQKEYDFVTSSVRRNHQGNLSLHHSDPAKAHDICTFVKSGTYHFIRGNLYKCGPVALMPEFDSQFPLDISDQDRALLNAYKPFTAQDFAANSQQVLHEIQKPLPQCRFCPDSIHQQRIAAQPKARSKTINIIKRS